MLSPMVRRRSRAVLGVLATLLVAACASPQPAGSLVLPSAASSPSAAATTFAQQVLDAAVLPPGARVTHNFASDLLKRPFETPLVASLVDLYLLYAVDELPNSVKVFLTSHLPPGASVSTIGTAGDPHGSVDGFTVSMPTSGPNANYAALVYEVAAYGQNATEFRVDAQVIWVANRPREETVPAGGIVEVTGFAQTPLMNRSSGPVTVQLTGAQAAALRFVADSLPLGPDSVCAEDALLYRIDFRPSPGSPAPFEMNGYECGYSVQVSRNGQALAPLNDAGCMLLNEVIGLLPAGSAAGTRSASGSCSR